jgi:beta-glucanase (GH16 family)
LIRRGITIVATIAAIGTFAALASAHPRLLAARKAQTNLVTRTVSKPVKSAGVYLVVVTVRAHSHVENVTVYVSGAAKREIRVSTHVATALDYHLTVSRTPAKLTARAVGHGPTFDLALTATHQADNKPASGSTTPPATPPSTGSTSTPSPSPALYPDPYQNTTPVFDDEFNGPAGSLPSSSNWTASTGQGQCGDDTLNTNTTNSANLEQNGQGQLAITALRNGSSYTSAQIETNNLPAGPYGAIEASIKLPPGQGLCGAFWLNGQPTWPNDGEIDILEAPSLSADPNYAYFTLHGPINPDQDGGNYQQWESYTGALGDLSAGFHTYGIVWSPNLIVWTIDGVAYASATPSSLVAGSTWVYNDSRSYKLILDLAVGGWPCQGSAAGTCPGATFPATMLVDWVKVYGQ